MPVDIFTVQQSPVGVYCSPLTYSHCDFSAIVDSLAKWIELQGVKGKSWGFQKLKVVSILPVHTQLAPIQSLRGTLQASVRPCSRNVRCSTSVAPATHAATGQCQRSSTGPGPTQSTSVRGECQHSTRGHEDTLCPYQDWLDNLWKQWSKLLKNK